MYHLLYKALENTNLTYSDPNLCFLQADTMGLTKKGQRQHYEQMKKSFYANCDSD